jgi:hypothetical protein
VEDPFAHILGPVFEAKRNVWVFRCPVCGNTVRNDSDMEPLCTGPHPSLDEHPPEVMVLKT